MTHDFLKQAPFKLVLQGKCAVFQIQADRWEWSNFLQKTAHGALTIPIWSHKFGET